MIVPDPGANSNLGSMKLFLYITGGGVRLIGAFAFAFAEGARFDNIGDCFSLLPVELASLSDLRLLIPRNRTQRSRASSRHRYLSPNLINSDS